MSVLQEGFHPITLTVHSSNGPLEVPIFPAADGISEAPATYQPQDILTQLGGGALVTSARLEVDELCDTMFREEPIAVFVPLWGDRHGAGHVSKDRQ